MNIVLVLGTFSIVVMLCSLFKGFIKESLTTIIAIGFILLLITGFITGILEKLGI